MAVEAELRKASDLLGDSSQVETKPLEANLNKAVIIDTKDDIGLAVVNVGKAHRGQKSVRHLKFFEKVNSLTVSQ
jgi:hypothetical protein